MSTFLSKRNYNLTIGATLLYGFVINYILCKYCASIIASANPIVIIIGYFISAFTGMLISERSDKPIISFIGYNLVVVPVGVLLSKLLYIKDISNAILCNTFLIVGFVTIMMIIAATIKPEFFRSIGGILLIALIFVIIAEIVFIVLGVIMPSIKDAVVAGIFALYIGYDWAKAQALPYTTDNAIKASINLYLDLINLFIRVLSASSSKKK